MTADNFAELECWFDRLVDRPAAETDAELAALARTDAALAARLRDLLAADAQLAAAATEPAIPALRVRPEANWEGRSVGDWQIGECLGTGGMGTVYRAQRRQAPDDVVALKLLRADRDDPHLRRRFALERKLLRRLHHPGIARLIDAGETAARQPYVVIEYVEGTHLLAYADRERLDLAQRISLVLDVCSAVAHAHARHVIHRDLKSSNILVTADGRTKLLDFGIAKLLPSPQHDDAAHTSTAQRFFSPASAAPEQITGGSIGRSCDVYALGALLYELLCGEVPIAVRGLTAGQAELAVTHQVPLPPSDRLAALPSRIANARARQRGCADRHALAEQLCGSLDRIVARALQKQPRQRYPTVERLAFELRAALRGGEAPAETWTDRVAATLADHPRIAAGLTLAGTALVPLAWLFRRVRSGSSNPA